MHCWKGFGEGTRIGLAMVLVYCLARFVELPPITSYLVVEGSPTGMAVIMSERRAPLNITAAQAGIALLADATPENDAGSQLASLRAVFQDTSATAVFFLSKGECMSG